MVRPPNVMSCTPGFAGTAATATVSSYEWSETSLPALLRERASLQPNDTAFTFIDYDEDPGGVPESLTWLQVYRRALNVARELRLCAVTG